MTLTSIDPQLQRDRWGRPLVVPIKGGKPVAYTRATTLAGATEDMNGLIKWKIGRALIGAVDQPHLILAVAAARDDKRKLNELAEQAAEAGGASAGATIGTALHAFVEKINHGESPTVPADYQADIAAYEAKFKLLTPLHIEEFVVNDDLKVAGTPDLIATYDGENYICDVKTGSIEYPHKMAAQLAIYAHSQLYDIATGVRTPLPAVSGQRGIIIHLPAGTGTCDLHFIDIAAGWEAVQLAVQVREWRSKRGLLSAIDEFQAAVDVLADAGLEPAVIDPVADLIAKATTVAELDAVWPAHKSEWTPELTVLAVQKKAQLSA